MAAYREIEAQISKAVAGATREILILCPYVKIDAFNRVIKVCRDNVAVTLICTWKLENFIAGASDAELYPYCVSKGVTLKANNRVHLKAWLFDRESLLLGSANITNRGLTDTPDSNYEFTVSVVPARADLAHLYGIAFESIDIDEEIHKRTIDALDRHPSHRDEYIDLLPQSDDDIANVDQLPLTPSPEALWYEYSNCAPIGRSHACSHDLDCLDVSSGLGQQQFFQALEKSFFSLPIVRRFIKRLCDSPMYFGESKALLQKLNELDPKLMRSDLTPITQNLFRWLEILRPDHFLVDRPNHSQRITRII